MLVLPNGMVWGAGGAKEMLVCWHGAVVGVEIEINKRWSCDFKLLRVASNDFKQKYDGTDFVILARLLIGRL